MIQILQGLVAGGNELGRVGRVVSAVPSVGTQHADIALLALVVSAEAKYWAFHRDPVVRCMA